MKTHAIIPIFIPHKGCPHDCVFCNQRRITARTETPSVLDIEQIIERNLSTIEKSGIKEVEIAYFGGSFTGLDVEEQSRLLEPAVRYKAGGRIRRIRLSTRPDYIDDAIIAHLKAHNVDAVELGAQSFDDDVLAASGRGHTAAQTVAAFESLKAAGFETALQLMSGLPSSTPLSDINSAKITAALQPTATRLYPSVILKDTALHDMYTSGKYIPPSQSEMLDTVKQMYIILNEANVKIMRVGLKSTDVINAESDALSGSYHPAFRQLVESSIAYDKILNQIDKTIPPLQCAEQQSITIYANSSSLSNAAGHKGSNRKALQKSYPSSTINFKADDSLPDNTYKVTQT